MRTAARVIGAVLGGCALAAVFQPFWPRAETPSAVEAELQSASRGLEREVVRLRAALAAARAARARVDAPAERDPELEDTSSPVVETNTVEHAGGELEERWTRAARVLDVLTQDRELARLNSRFSREESNFPNWRSEHFLEDPVINPRGIDLTESQRQHFEVFYARAFQFIRSLELKRRAVVAEGVVRKLEELLESDEPELLPEPADGALTVSLSKDLRVVLPRDEFPEIAVLRQEQRAAIVEWLLEAEDFIASLK